MDVAISHNSELLRFELLLNGELVGVAQYSARPGLRAFTGTQVDPAVRGQGLAGQLLAFALTDCRANQIAVLPFCPYVSGYIERHPELLDLVPAAMRHYFEL